MPTDEEVFIGRRYISDEIAPLLENPLVKMPGYIFLQRDLPAGSIAQGMAGLMAQCIHYLEVCLGIKEKITCAVVASPTHNAGAIYSTDTIVLTVGLQVRIQSLITKLSRSAQIDKIFASQVPSLLFRNVAKSRRQAIAELMNNVDRTAALGHLYRSMPMLLSFVAFHELGHLVNGHRVFRQGASTMSEAQEVIPDDIYLTNRALEFDADAFAVEHTYRMQLEYINRGFLGHSLEKPKEWVFIMVALAAYVVAVSFDTREPLPGQKLTHPIAPVRARFITLFLEQFLANALVHEPGCPNLSDGHLGNVIRGVENAISEIGNSALNPDDFSFWEGVARRDHQETFSRWQAIQPALEAAKYHAH
jgi:hypothetical protein